MFIRYPISYILNQPATFLTSEGNSALLPASERNQTVTKCYFC